MRRKIYDPLNRRLFYLEHKASEEFWDKKWEKTAESTFASPPRHGLTIRITRRYLPSGSRVLEGGCGLGDFVYALHRAGYIVDGIDYAPGVVQAINAHWPMLRVTQGDVRNLPFGDGVYDGYWSIGVIEHFPEGYDTIALEMQRVLRPGGYLFLSFPSFNPFRQSLAAQGKYTLLSECSEIMSNFYQYALNPVDVKEHFERLGFEQVEDRGTSSLQGLAEDSRLADYIMRFFDRFPPRMGIGVSMMMDLVIGRYAGHSCLLILRKNDSWAVS